MKILMRRCALTLILVCALGSCDRPLGYEVVVRNTGDHDVDDVRLEYGHFVDEPGVIPPGVHKGHLDVQEPLPAKAIVGWRDATGVTHRESVTIIPKREFKGVLVFEIDSRNQVRVVTEAPPRH